MSGRSFSERRRLLRSRFNSEWWSIFFGGPIGNFLNALIADVPWITPNGLTWLGFFFKLAACPLLLAGDRTLDLVAVALLQLNVVCDCMDGSLARYRAAGSVFGAYLDKITDALGLCAVTWTAGVRVFHDSGDLVALLLFTGAGASLVVRGYLFWVVAAIEVANKTQRRSAGVEDRIDYRDLDLGARVRLYGKSMVRIFAFAESDLYFWIGLGVVFGVLRPVAYLLGAATGVWLIILLVVRTRTVVAIDREVRRKP